MKFNRNPRKKNTQIATIISITVRTNDGQTLEISIKDLEFLGNNDIPFMGWYYESEDGNLLIDIEESK